MKTFKKNLIRTTILFLLLAACGSAISQNKFVTINGLLKDTKSGEKISHAAITVPNTGIGTVSNSDGEFTLKVNTTLNAEFFEVSHIGYTTAKFKISEAAGKETTFNLDIQPIMLKEISVMPGDARGVVEIALSNIKKNYSQVPNM
ncbi:MAG: carboxypeptidase-like regulatory domain-containing protein, partial [Bacteroidota bacterium]